MAFTVTREVLATPERVWAAVSDISRHTAHVPLTTVVPDPLGDRLGAEHVARTAIGPVGFDDSMLVTAWEPPQRMRIVKTGRLLAGWAEITVAPRESGSRVTWTEELWLRGAPRLTRRLADAAGQRLFGSVLDGLLEDLA